MIQPVKVTVRWHDINGDIVGASKEVNVDLPRWGKWGSMRKEISKLLSDLERNLERKSSESVAALRDYILDAFNLDSIVQIKCRTKGSYLNLKDDKLKEFLIVYEEQRNEIKENQDNI